ncbi:MAG: histidinol dehydrogenase [Bacteroidales bacterium]|nr:histidinol dehydrogenase [Bacteroidales bacterium]MBN2821009.1 histidinol dehydrogenase [Bacteroidales bacterium]
MEVIKYPPREKWQKLLERPTFESTSLDSKVREVIEDVKKRGDEAVKEYSLKFDKVELTGLIVSDDEIKAAIHEVSEELKNSIEIAINNIQKFHEAQKPAVIKVETSMGVECWQKPIPITKVGLYIPGGTAPLFSTILMLAIPAKIAGCKELVLCTPPGKNGKVNPAIVYVASRIGIDKIFKIGGIQAIASMAYGTESVPKVYKIFGPGNQYVTAAKQMVSRDAVAIDMPAGPSEVAVVADEQSNPVYVASDLLSQAEHGADSQVILFTDSESFIEKLNVELEKQLSILPKKEYATKSLENSKTFLLKDKTEIMQMVNAYAPEHLILSTKDADNLALQIVNAGSVFIGENTPESAGDYASGTNHTLPTHGWAKSYSGVNLDSFYKKVTFQKISKEGLKIIGPAIENMAEAEELIAHKRAVSLRLKD